MPNGMYGGVRGRKTKVGRKLSFSSYSISLNRLILKMSVKGLPETRNALISLKPAKGNSDNPSQIYWNCILIHYICHRQRNISLPIIL